MKLTPFIRKEAKAPRPKKQYAPGKVHHTPLRKPTPLDAYILHQNTGLYIENSAATYNQDFTRCSLKLAA